MRFNERILEVKALESVESLRFLKILNKSKVFISKEE